MDGHLIDIADVPSFTGKRAGKEFEEIVLERLDQEEEEGNGCFDRAGVKASVLCHNDDGTVVAQLMKSFPDIDGALPSGRQAVLECKVCSGASIPLNEYREDIGTRAKSNQLRFMRRRARCGVLAGFLIHWNERVLKTKAEPAETYFFPVSFRLRFWRSFSTYDVRAINREACEAYGRRVLWTRRGREKKYRPDVLSVLLKVAGEERVS